MNEFVKENTRGEGTAFTENGAISYATIGSTLLDQFGKAGTARGRDLLTVWNEQATLWAENPEAALRFPFYLRMITRKCNILDGESTESVQRGQGARDEAFKRLLWVATYHPKEFYDNLWLLPVVGSWKDLWVLLTMDYTLKHDKFFDLIVRGIRDKNNKDLVKKYLPQIRSSKKCNTDWAIKTNKLAKEFAAYVGWSAKEYREFKSTGRAHEFQRVICGGFYDNIKWGTIPGKALLNLVNGKFLGKHGLTDKYVEWLETQPMAKFNGYPFELGHKLGGRYASDVSLAQKLTIDKQFKNLIHAAKDGDGAIKGNVLCALDTSGSMGSQINGANGITSFDVCISLGIYFSELNQGAFHNVVAMFDNTSEMKELKGDSFCDKWRQITSTRTAWGGTNFQSLIDLLIDTRMKRPDIPESEFPKTLLVISDMQFNDCGEHSNYQTAINRMKSVFSDEFLADFKFVWWYCAGRTTEDFPSTMDDAGTYMFSGFDGSIISTLLGGEAQVNPETGETKKPTMQEIVDNALHQEVLNLIA